MFDILDQGGSKLLVSEFVFPPSTLTPPPGSPANLQGMACSSKHVGSLPGWSSPAVSTAGGDSGESTNLWFHTQNVKMIVCGHKFPPLPELI